MGVHCASLSLVAISGLEVSCTVVSCWNVGGLVQGTGAGPRHGPSAPLLQGWYIVTYALGIYHLNLFIAFLSPKVDPSLMEDSGTVEIGCLALSVWEACDFVHFTDCLIFSRNLRNPNFFFFF